MSNNWFKRAQGQKTKCRLANFQYLSGVLLVAFFFTLVVGCQIVDGDPTLPEEEGTETAVEGLATRIVAQFDRESDDVAPTPIPEDVTLDISFIGDYESLDPQATENENAVNIIENVFAGLTRYNAQHDAIESQLANSWEVSPDGLIWTFELREDIYWLEVTGGEATVMGLGELKVDPIRPVHASDVVFAIQRICDPNVPTPDEFIYFIIEGCQAVNSLSEVTSADLEVIGARPIDDNTLEITLTRPASHFLTLTSLWQMRPVPQEKVLELEEEWSSVGDIVTSGPFILDPTTNVEDQTVLTRNPHWPLPFSGNVDAVNIVHLDSEEIAYNMWEARELDLSPIPLIGQADIVNLNEFKSHLAPRQAVFYLGYNFDSPIFGLPEARRAFSWAIDRDTLINEVFGDRGLPARHFGPVGVFGAPPWDEVGIGYSPDRARLELDKSSYGHCSLLPDITYLINSSDVALQQAELLREMWVDELGCVEEQIIIEQVELGELLARTHPNASDRPDIWDLGWSSYYPDENNWLTDQLHCQDSENRQRRPCSQSDDMMRSANSTTSTDERWRLYREIEGLFFGEGAIAPIAPLFIRADYFLRQAWLTNTPARFGGEHFDTYVLDFDLKELEQGR